MRYPFIFAKMAIIIMKTTSAAKYVENLKSLYIVGGYVKKGISILINRVPDELWMEVRDIV